jgi:uncharacterized membrane protein
MSTNPPASEQPSPNPSGLTGSSEPAVRDIAEILVSHLEASTRYSGPLPPPEVLENYDRIVPGAAKKIIAMALRQSRHRQELERKVIESDIRRSRDGLWVGGALSLTSILLGAVAVFTGHDTAGATIATATVVSLAGVFVYGTTSRRKEREQQGKAVMEAKPRRIQEEK